MARWRQVYNEEAGKYEMVPIDASAANRDSGVAIHGFFEPFKSPIDGSVITDNKSLREHNRKHNVVNSAEFSPEHFERKRKEREAVSTADRFKTKQQLHENWERVERGYRPHIDQYNGD